MRFISILILWYFPGFYGHFLAVYYLPAFRRKAQAFKGRHDFAHQLARRLVNRFGLIVGVFCDNLRRFLAGELLLGVIDKDKGY